jgi:probable HAF family extracellular repeat protein
MGNGIGNSLNITAVTYENGQVTDLNGLIDPAAGWTLEAAEGINASGQIVGYGIINGNTHAFLLTPGSQGTTGGSSFATLSSGTLTVNGTSGDDAIGLTSDGTNVTATLNGTASQAFAISSVTSLTVNGNAGNDSITIDSTMPASLGVSVQGGPGDDTIIGGPGNDTLGGGQGNDSIQGGPGDDSVKGGAGDDTLLGGKGNDTLFGGPGNDLMHGGLGDDYLNGGAGTDYMSGGAGNNTFYAVNGTADQVFAGTATNDSLFYSTADNPIIESGVISAGNQTLV